MNNCSHLFFSFTLTFLLFFAFLKLRTTAFPPLFRTFVSQCPPQVSQLAFALVKGLSHTTRNCCGSPPTCDVISKPCRMCDYWTQLASLIMCMKMHYNHIAKWEKFFFFKTISNVTMKFLYMTWMWREGVSSSWNFQFWPGRNSASAK